MKSRKDTKKVVILGIGNFGKSWANEILPQCAELATLVGVVEPNIEKWNQIAADIPKFTSMEKAIEQLKPDLVINVTPPSLHTDLNIALLKKGLPVLCEKPISENIADAQRMEKYLTENGGFLMIAENYRYASVFRKCKELILSNELGKVRNGQCQFRHFHPDFSMFYHGQLKHPLLTDVAIHHLDIARYLLNEEPLQVYTKESSAPYAWYGDRPATANILTEMTNHVTFNYFGTLASSVSDTSWNGNWQIECDNGILRICNNKLYRIVGKGDDTEEIFLLEDDSKSREHLLHEAITAIKENRKGETDFFDNRKTFFWLHSAIASAEQNKIIDVSFIG